MRAWRTRRSEILVGEANVGQGLAGLQPQAGDTQQFLQLLVVQVGLPTLQEGVYGFGELLSLVLFVHSGTLFMRSRSFCSTR